MSRGFIKLARKTFHHYLWNEKRPFSKFEAWLDLLQLAAHCPTKRIIRGHLIEIGRGEIIASLRYLGERWNWKKDKVAAFLTTIEGDQMIRRSTRQQESVVTLCNYEHYNGCGDTESDSKPDTDPTRTRQAPDKDKNYKNIKNNTHAPPNGAGLELPGMEHTPEQPDPPKSQRCLPEGWKKLSETQKSRVRVNFNTPTMIQVGKALGRRESTLWTVAEAEALLAVKPSEEEIEAIVEFYQASIPPDLDRRRTALVTLLNHWNGELDKARLWLANSKIKTLV